MIEHSTRRTLGRWRRVMFVVWVGLTIVAAIYLAMAAPFATYFHQNMWLVGVIVPPLMIVLLGIGIAWLVWLVTSSPQKDRQASSPPQ